MLPTPAVRVSRLGVTAIKGLGLREVGEIEVAADGVPGDRALFVVDDKDTLLSATRTPAFLAHWSRLDGEVLTVGRGGDVVLSGAVERGPLVRAHFFGDRYVTGHLVPGPWSALLSDLAGRAVRLVRAADPIGGYDVHPFTLVSEASVRALGREGDGTPLDVRRFRMTVTVEGVAAFEEDTWRDRLLTIGQCVVRVGGPVKRCAAVQRHPEGGEVATNALRMIKDVRGVSTSELGRGLVLGVYGEVEEPGLVRVGDPVRCGGAVHNHASPTSSPSAASTPSPVHRCPP